MANGINTMTPELEAYIQRIAEEIAALPTWHRKTIRRFYDCAVLAHKHHVSLRAFLKLAEDAYRGTDPMDLPPKAAREKN